MQIHNESLPKERNTNKSIMACMKVYNQSVKINNPARQPSVNLTHSSSFLSVTTVI